MAVASQRVVSVPQGSREGGVVSVLMGPSTASWLGEMARQPHAPAQPEPAPQWVGPSAEASQPEPLYLRRQ